MVIYLSMIGVVFLMYVLHQGMCAGHNLSCRNRASKVEALIVFGYIIFWVGIRNSFADTAAYIQSFNAISWKDLTTLSFQPGSDWGFELLQILFKTYISSDYHAWLMFLAVISGSCLAVTFRRYSPNFFYTMFLFLASTAFSWMMNGIRQFLAVSILFACTPLLERKQWIKYLIAVLCCSTIHATALIMIPVYFLVQGKPWSIKTLLMIVGVVLAVTFTAQFTTILDAVLKDTTYANSVDQFAQDDGVNPLRVVVASVPVILAFMGRRILNGEKNPFINLCINMSIISPLLYAIGMVTSGILIGRLPIYVQLYQFILLPIVIDQCFNKESRKILYELSMLGYMVYFHLMSRGFYYSSSLTGRIY